LVLPAAPRCLACKPSKLNANKAADRMKARREWLRLEGLS
jgi:hypothetical protein